MAAASFFACVRYSGDNFLQETFMALRNQPYLALYVQDFMTDEKLAECSASTTGIYIRLMCIMHKSDEYGTVLLKQKDKQNDEQIKNFACKLIRMMPYTESEIENGLRELVSEGVVQIDGDKLFQKRMVADNSLSEKRSIAGAKGGKVAQAKVQANRQANTEDENEYEIESDIEHKNSVLRKESIEPIGNYEGYLKLREDQQFDIGILPIDGQAAILLDMFKTIYSERNKDEYPVGTWDRRNLMMMIKDNGFKAVEHFIQEYFDLDTKHTIKEFSSNISDGFQMIKKRVGVSPERMFG